MRETQAERIFMQHGKRFLLPYTSTPSTAHKTNGKQADPRYSKLKLICRAKAETLMEKNILSPLYFFLFHNYNNKQRTNADAVSIDSYPEWFSLCRV